MWKIGYTRHMKKIAVYKYRFRGSRLTRHQQQIIAGFLKLKKKHGKEYQRAFQALVDIDNYKKELKGTPVKSRARWLKKEISLRWQTITPPAKLGASERYRSFAINSLASTRLPA